MTMDRVRVVTATTASDSGHNLFHEADINLRNYP